MQTVKRYSRYAVGIPASRIVIIWLVATSIGLARLPHAVVGAGEAVASIYLAQASIGQFAAFLALTSLGNGLGGVFFLAALEFGHSTGGIGGPVKAE